MPTPMPAIARPGGKAAAAHQPALHGPDRGHIGATAAKSDTEAVRRIDLDQIPRRAGKRQPDAKESHTDHSERTRAEAIGLGPPQPEIQKTGQ